ncbi:hypothetical protein Tco_0567958 [Tanacetum coccineum]
MDERGTIYLLDRNTVIRSNYVLFSTRFGLNFTKTNHMKHLTEVNHPIKISSHVTSLFGRNEAEKRREKKRMVVDYKKINEATIGDSHNLPNMQELLNTLPRKCHFLPVSIANLDSGKSC